MCALYSVFYGNVQRVFHYVETCTHKWVYLCVCVCVSQIWQSGEIQVLRLCIPDTSELSAVDHRTIISMYCKRFPRGESEMS